MLHDLKGLKALVFGASSGIGADIALALASHGVDTAVHYCNGESRAKAVAQSAINSGVNAPLIKANLCEQGDAASAVSRAALAMGGLDILINNAGSMVGRAKLEDIDRQLYDNILDLNAWSVIEASQAALPYLRASDSGCIINLSTVAARNGGGIGAGLYASAKAFTTTMTRNMSKELANDNIRVNAISPGVIETPFHAETPKDILEGLTNAIPLGRLGKPQECAGAALFLASPSMSSYITGHIIDINGGLMMV